MFRSKQGKVGCLIAGLIVVSCFGFYIFSNQTKNNDNSVDIQKEQVNDSNVAQDISAKKEIKKEEILNPAQKYYKDNLEQDEINFVNRIKSSNDKDLEFNKLQTKFIKAADVLNEKYADKIDIADIYYQNNWIKISCVEGIYYYAVNSDYLQKNTANICHPVTMNG